MGLIVKTHVPTEAQDVGKFGQCDQSTYGTCSPHHLNHLPKSVILSILLLFYYTSFLFFQVIFFVFLSLLLTSFCLVFGAKY